MKEKSFRNGANPFWAALLIVVAIAWLAGDRSVFGDFPSGYSFTAIIFSTMMLAFAWLGAIRPVVKAGPSGVVVTNPLDTRRISWNEMEGFRVESQLVIVLASGAQVRCWAVQPARAALMTGRRSWVHDVIDELEKMRDSYRTPPGTSAPQPPS